MQNVSCKYERNLVNKGHRHKIFSLIKISTKSNIALRLINNIVRAINNLMFRKLPKVLTCFSASLISMFCWRGEAEALVLTRSSGGTFVNSTTWIGTDNVGWNYKYIILTWRSSNTTTTSTLMYCKLSIELLHVTLYGTSNPAILEKLWINFG